MVSPTAPVTSSSHAPAATPLDALFATGACCVVTLSESSLIVSSASGACGPLLGAEPSSLAGLSAGAILCGIEAIGPERNGSFAAVASATARRLLAFWARSAGTVEVVLFDASLAADATLSVRTAGAAAHDLRNPLASIKLNLQSLARTPSDGRVARRLAIALREVARLERLLDILAECGRLCGTFGTYTVEDIEAAVRAAFEAEPPDGRLDLRFDLPGTLPAIRCDRGRIALALVQLACAALRAVPGMPITVAARRREPFLRWSVGASGMPAPPSRSLPFALAERVASECGGRFTIEETEAGVSFAVYLPAAE